MAAKRSWPVQGDGEVHLVVQRIILGVPSSTMQSQTESTSFEQRHDLLHFL